MKNCVVIYNPNSGKNNKAIFLKDFENILKKYNYNCKIIPTDYKGHAREIVENLEEVDLIISVGGDGTFNEIITGNFNRKKRLLVSHIPIGTANDIGAMFGYKKNVIYNLEMLLKGEIKTIDICTINNQPFVYVAGFGKFVNISYETPRDLKKKFGYLAYLMEGVKDLNSETNLVDLKYTINGEVHEGKYSFVLISNANRIAGIDNFYKEVKLDDNCFEVLLCDLYTKKDIAKSLYHLTTKDITKVPGFSFYRTNNFKIEFKEVPKKFWSIDGEAYEQNENTIEIKIINGVEILLPKKNVSKLFLQKEE